MKKIFFKSLIGILVFSSIAKAQTPDEYNLKKYWNYRDRFQKYFIKLGKNPGNGINISNIDNIPDNISNGGWANTTPTAGSSVLHGYKRVGDAMILQGEYIGVLATQYRLLKDSGKDVQPTLNELYYAMEAINRVDRSAEPYFSASSPPNLNGFFLRDDIPKNLADDWNNQYIKTKEPRDLYEGISSDFYQDNDAAPGNIRNEESQDQMIGLMLGLAYVTKLVDPSEFAKPTAADAGFNIVLEAKAITYRMMNHLIKLNFLEDNNDPSELNGGVCDVKANWLITNPTTGKKVGDATNKSEPRPYSYGFAKAAEKITGNSVYNAFNIVHEADDIIGDGHLCVGPHNVSIPLTNVNSAFWSTFANANIGPADFIATIPGVSFTYSYPDFSTTPPTIRTKTIGWDAFNVTIDNKLPDFNVNLALTLATVGGTWSHDNVNRWGDGWNMWIFDLAYSVLHDEAPKHDKAFYEAILNTAPDDCFGPHNFNSISGVQNPFLYSNGWYENSRWGHPFGPSKFTRGEFNGNDYMLLYNLYQLVFKSSSTLPEYKDVSCPCETSPVIKLNTTGAILNTNTLVERKFPEYLDFDVRIKNYLVEDLTVKSSKQLNLETDLVVCNNSTLYNFLNGSITVGNPSGLSSSITVRKGSTLHIGTNGKVFVYDNSKILIEEGATLIIDQGAKIQLLGDNAVLEIKGDLKLTSNAIFTFTYPGTNSGYVKFSRETPWDNLPHILGAPGCSIELIGKNKNDKILEIAQDILFVSQFQSINLFKIQSGTVEFTIPAKQYISVDAPTSFVACKFISNDVNDAVAVWGQPICQITNCLFDRVSVAGMLFMYGNKLSMSYTEIKNCNTAGLGTQGMGVNLFNTNFNSNESGMNSQLFTQNSTASGAKFNDNNYGASIWGSPVEVTFTSCKLKNNFNFGLDLVGPTKAKFRCGEVNKNFIGFSVARTASLSMNTTLAGGYVDAQNNVENTILLDYANSLDINNGYNDLRLNVGGTATFPNNIYNLTTCTNFANCPVEIAGSLKQFPGAPVLANNNKWQTDNTKSLVTTPYLPSSEDKFTEVISTIDGITRLHFTDIAQSDRAPCGFWDPAPCPTCPASFLEVCPTCNTINTTSFINKKTNAAVKEAMAQMDSTVFNGHKQAVDMFHQVLKYPLPTPTEGDKFVTNLAETEMIVSLAQSIENNQVLVSDSTIAPEVLKTIEIQEDKILKATINSRYLDQLYGTVEKALIYYIAKRRIEAIATLDNALTFVQPNEQEYVTYLKCLISNEQSLLSRQINQIEFLNSVSLCTPPNRVVQRSASYVPGETTDEETNEYKISLFPNPASDKISIEYHLSEIEQTKFIIYDVTGKILYESILKGGNRTEEIADLHLSSGIYLYKIITEDNKIIQQSKLTIIK